jgi:hypothetical protein
VATPPSEQRYSPRHTTKLDPSAPAGVAHGRRPQGNDRERLELFFAAPLLHSPTLIPP